MMEEDMKLNDPKALPYRKQYAMKCLESGRIHTRGFDNCFENGDGDEVVKHIMKFCLAYPSKSEMQARKKDKIIKTLQEKGFWDNWIKYVD
jgi:hypothetical protein